MSNPVKLKPQTLKYVDNSEEVGEAELDRARPVYIADLPTGGGLPEYYHGDVTGARAQGDHRDGHAVYYEVGRIVTELLELKYKVANLEAATE